jgi:hypothetical protein
MTNRVFPKKRNARTWGGQEARRLNRKFALRTPFRATCVPKPVGEKHNHNYLVLQTVINGQTGTLIG